MTTYNVLGVSCDIVEGKVTHVYSCTEPRDSNWQGEAMVVHYPYEAWGYMKSSEVCINNFKKNFEEVVEATQKNGEQDADFLSDCGDFNGGVMLCPEPTVYWSKEKNGVYRVVVDFQFLCENEDESTDSQCCTTIYMTEEVFNECIDIGSPNACRM